eukprot:Blabericola_migrator_1__7105@NODE_35_length_17941_cov_94_946347_g31_i0_p6_GENE_NODE_35_length_17941_cov_94_946347_g31_i0NODE_35_length_17941_cov_94_946347_g31_i0_p6_ORF_typecomplete_len394_score49_06TPT/PF03151_16/1_4e53UAA/PF08449_11/1_6e18EamA/PF00892_20/1_4e05EamA/PF00892_20/0_18CRTlike/PF08627_10/0_0023Nuc_sug_transp/PF04142_15/0_045SLC35F/PF06027_12/1_6e03SLC35F/PF06027_12/0_0077PhoLip_ATPase_N/PF16209_5/0_042PUNUT/PF16913_5/1_5Trp_oprn_chp/PF09534_10/1_8e04Trp_oprn_chp/PF09534_10/6_6e02Trp
MGPTQPATQDELDWQYSYNFNPVSRSTYRRFFLKLWFYKSRFLDVEAWRNLWSPSNKVANIYFIAWFILNIVITLTSKAMFANFKFPYPMMLTAVHFSFTALGSQIAAWLHLYDAVTITPKNIAGLFWFSLVFTVNIWLSNYALLVVSVAVHQVFRTTIPLFTMLLSLVVYREIYPLRMLPSVLLVIVGVAATVWGDMDVTVYGGVIVAVGCAFSSLKGLMSQKAQIGAQGLETFDLLRAVCPMATLELIILGLFNGEVASLVTNTDLDMYTFWNLVLQGVLAFTLNFVSFKCAALKNPLTMTIAGNIKQVITPLIALAIFGGALTRSLVFGLVAATIGAIWYSEESRIRKESMQREALPTKEPDDMEMMGRPIGSPVESKERVTTTAASDDV